MGINIEMIKYNEDKLYGNFIDEMNIPDTEANIDKFSYVLQLHGLIIGEHYVILNNEEWEDYNYYWMLSRSLAFAFGFIERRKPDWTKYDDDTLTLTHEQEVICDRIYDVILNTPNTNSATDIKVDEETDIIEKIREYLEDEKDGN